MLKQQNELLMGMFYREDGGVSSLCDDPAYKDVHGRFNFQMFPQFDNDKRDDIEHCLYLKETIAGLEVQLDQERRAQCVFLKDIRPINIGAFNQTMRRLMRKWLELLRCRRAIECENCNEEVVVV